MLRQVEKCWNVELAEQFIIYDDVYLYFILSIINDESLYYFTTWKHFDINNIIFEIEKGKCW